jgi:carbamoyltransferase
MCKREEIPATTHVDGTGRLQTVSRKTNPLYWKLIKAFEVETEIPVLLNRMPFKSKSMKAVVTRP